MLAGGGMPDALGPVVMIINQPLPPAGKERHHEHSLDKYDRFWTDSMESRRRTRSYLFYAFSPPRAEIRERQGERATEILFSPRA